MDKPRCNCGVFGIFNTDDAAVTTYYGLHALQHRGQEAAGIVTSSIGKKGKRIFNVHKSFGLVSEVFADTSMFNTILKGSSAIGHNRYSTTGSADSVKNVAPLIANYRLGNIAIAHNGNLTNAKYLREKLINEGAIFQTTTDSEVILHLIARSKLADQVSQIHEALNQVEGAYSLVILTDDKLIAARDPYGFRPLSIGKISNSFVIASETCAFDINSITYLRDVEPGEMIIIDKNVIDYNSIKSFKINKLAHNKRHCIFEYIYFSRPDSRTFGSNVDKIRRKLGKVLAKNHSVVDPDGDKVIVISVPDSSNTAAIGYQVQLEREGIPSKLEIGLIRSHYIGRTFITPGQMNREVGVKIKFNIVKGVLEGRTVVLVDDSIVRGTTSKQLVRLLREANPKRIHLRISSPPILYPCYYGMDFPSAIELIANRMSRNVEKIEKFLEVDSLEYLTLDELLEAMVDHEKDQFCTACFSGKYPTTIDKNFNKEEHDD
ncbi:MAG: amidophosphoribosyltransferase [Ignavibacteria bacterium RBG_13_36_8]|nr:MAG: amidophosphoribosyltransferase [Ignavibacteria bacterium RBG_13_36_8]